MHIEYAQNNARGSVRFKAAALNFLTHFQMFIFSIQRFYLSLHHNETFYYFKNEKKTCF